MTHQHGGAKAFLQTDRQRHVLEFDLGQRQGGRLVWRVVGVSKQRLNIPGSPDVLCQTESSIFERDRMDVGGLAEQAPNIQFEADALCLNECVILGVGHGDLGQIDTHVRKAVPPRQCDVVHEEIAFKLRIHGVQGPGFPRVTAHPCQRSKCGTKGHWNGQHQGERATSQRERRGEGHWEV